MTIKDCIDIVDSNKPNQYTITDKVRWLSFIDEKIINDVLKTHEGYDGRYDDFTGYSDDKLSVTLIAPSPYDRLYTQYLKMKIDEENGETARYNNAAILFNTYYDEYKKYYNKHHMPLTNERIKEIVKNKVNQNKGLTDAEMENLKNELTFILTEYFSNTISNDKVYDVVTKYMQNNTELFKGKDGKTPIKGQDYFTDAEIKAITDELSKYAKDEVQGMSRGFENTLREINLKYNNLSSAVDNQLPNKVDKVVGMGLSEANYTANDKTLLYRNNNKIKALEQNMAYKVDAVPGKGLSSNDYTPEDKALLYEMKTQMSGKVDKEFGKGLSTEDYTTEEKEQLSNLGNRVKDIEEKEHITEHLTNFFKDRPQGLYVDDLDNLTYENTGGGVFLWGKPQDGAKQNDIVFVTQGFSPRRREFLVTFQMRISLTPLAYAEFDSYNIKQRYQTFSHPSVQEPDGWSEWEDIYTTFKKVPYGKSIDDLYGEEHFGYYMCPYKPSNEITNANEYFNFLIVDRGYYIDEILGDIATTFQTRFKWDGFEYMIQTRKQHGDEWTVWEDCFGTGGGAVDQTYNPDSANAQSGIAVAQAISQIPTGGGGGDEKWVELVNVALEEEVNVIEYLFTKTPAKKIVVLIDTPSVSADTNYSPMRVMTRSEGAVNTFNTVEFYPAAIPRTSKLNSMYEIEMIEVGDDVYSSIQTSHIVDNTATIQHINSKTDTTIMKICKDGYGNQPYPQITGFRAHTYATFPIGTTIKILGVLK
jgi:hypothetical protein